MSFFSKAEIETKYQDKIAGCYRRKILLKFTKTEFIRFCKYLDKDPTCAYTGVRLVKTKDHNHQATIERIDSEKPYSLTNCVWASKQSNQLKGRFDTRNNASKASFSKDELSILGSVLKSNVEYKLQSIYKFVKGEDHNMSETNGENEMSNENLENKEQNNISDSNPDKLISEATLTTTNNTVNMDVSIAQGYSMFAEYYKEDVDFLLSFNEYKKLVTKKQCQLTSQKFDSEHKPSLLVLDKSKPVELKNLIVIDLKLRHLLDAFIGKVKFDQKTLKKLFKNLGDKL